MLLKRARSVRTFPRGLFRLMLACVCGVASCSSTIIAADPLEAACVEDAQTTGELRKCMGPSFRMLQKRVDAAASRITHEFPDNLEMSELVRMAKEGWRGHRDSYCGLVGAVASDGQVKGELSVSAERKYLECLLRVTEEFEASLLRLGDDVR